MNAGFSLSFVSADEAQTAALHPVEQRHADAMSPRRRAEYALGRIAARTLLPDGAGPIESMSTGAPIDPSGAWLSITHKPPWAAAARHTEGPVGVDLERRAGSRLPIARNILSPKEDTAWNAQHDASHIALVFAIKEASYKAWHPTWPHQIGFKEAYVVRREDSALVRGIGRCAHLPPLIAKWKAVHDVWLVVATIEELASSISFADLHV